MSSSDSPTPPTDDIPTNISVNSHIKQSTNTHEVASYDYIRNLSLRLFVLIVLVIFIGETLVMLLLNMFPSLPKPFAGLLDALLISVISIPLLYFFFYVPFNQHLNKRKKAEEKLTRFAAIIEQATEGIVVTDVEGTIEFANPAQCKISGYTLEELIGQNPRILKGDNHPDDFFETMWQTLSSGNAWKGVICNKKKDGTPYSVDANISPIVGHDGNIINYVAACHDITNEINLEQQIRQAQKMEAVGVLAGGIAHDFNNILSVIIGYTDMAAEEIDEGDPVRDDLEEALKASYRAKDLIRQILTFSRRTDSKLHPIKLDPVVKESLKLMRASLPPSVDIISEIESHTGSAMADPTQIGQVIMNLCANASHAMDENGRLNVQLRQVWLDEPIVSSNQKVEPGPHVLLAVTDTGHGMSQSTIDRIFDPFYTTKDVGKGTGLGLAAVYGIVSNHHGVITVESEIEKGTTFRAYFPIVEDVPPLDSTTSETVSQLNGSERILVVDDEESISVMIKRNLGKHGYQVVSTTSASEALAMFNADPSAFDMVITDLSMPQMSGSELAEQILAQRPSLPLIILSGLNECDLAKNIGVASFLTKPISITDLATTIRDIFDRKPTLKTNSD